LTCVNNVLNTKMITLSGAMINLKKNVQHINNRMIKMNLKLEETRTKEKSLQSVMKGLHTSHQTTNMVQRVLHDELSTISDRLTKIKTKKTDCRTRCQHVLMFAVFPCFLLWVGTSLEYAMDNESFGNISYYHT
jgi:predicted  nucleic acid-binding Zn-ribbon protein